MKKKILMQLTAAALTAGMCISVAGAAFTDVPANAWYSKAVTTCEEANLMKGYTDGNFRPSANVTRAECAQILARFNSGASMTIPYADVQEGKWYYDVVRNFGSYLGGSDMDKKNYTDLAASQYFYPENPSSFFYVWSKLCIRESSIFQFQAPCHSLRNTRPMHDEQF